MKKFIFFVAAALTSMSMLAAEPTLESYNWTKDVVTFESVFTTTEGVTLSAPGATDWKGNMGGYNYVSSASGVDASASWNNSIGISATNPIDSIAIFWAPNGSNASYLAWCGWESGVTPSVEVGANHGVTESYTASKSYDAAIWQTIDLSGKNLTTVYLARQLKKLTESGKTISNFGGNQTINFLGFKVWVNGQAAPSKYTVTYYDGTTVLGTESVKENETPKNYANYESKAHATFDGWYNEADFQTVADFSAAITADKAFYGKWTAEAFTASTSLNIEQGVLDNSTKWDINAALAEYHIAVANLNGLDSLSSKSDRNEPYLGMKFKAANAYAEAGLNAGDILRVKFGNIGCAVNVSGLTEASIATDAAKVFEYTATAQGYVRFTTSGSGTVVLKQIMINDTIQAVVLPGDTVKPTPTPTPTAAAVLYEAVFSNGVKGAIYNDTVAVPYVGEIPSFVSDSVSAGATAAFADNKITVTNDTVNHVYNVLFVALTAPAFSADTVTFDGSETAYIYDHYGFDSSKGWKFAKNLNESSNMRITEGKTRIYMALPACASVELITAATARAIKVYVNGELASVTTSGDFKLNLDATKVNFVAIESNQTSGDGGFSQMVLSNTPFATKYTITCTKPENGSLKASASSAVEGTEITLTVKASSGYEIESVSVVDAEGNAVALSDDYKFTMPASNVTASATFKALPTEYTITLDYGDGNQGKIYSSAKKAVEGTSIKITITPKSYYELDQLTVIDEAGQAISFNMSDSTFVMPASNVTVTATFKAILYTVTITPCENGTVVADPVEAAKGDSVQLTITPAEGYELDKLTVVKESGSSVTVRGNNKFAMPGENVTVTATFKATETAVSENRDAQKAMKMVVNGQIVIRKGNKFYNALGAEL